MTNKAKKDCIMIMVRAIKSIMCKGAFSITMSLTTFVKVCICHFLNINKICFIIRFKKYKIKTQFE